jgi:capsule polysaccharide export protein KpsC/LpsZ
LIFYSVKFWLRLYKEGMELIELKAKYFDLMKLHAAKKEEIFLLEQQISEIVAKVGAKEKELAKEDSLSEAPTL